MNSRHILAVLILATAILYAQAISGANPAVFDTDTSSERGAHGL